MPSIKVTGDQAEYSEISIENQREDYRCHICGNDNVKMLAFENSCGDNNWVSCCFKCLREIMDKEDINSN
jgi:hypothetical protein